MVLEKTLESIGPAPTATAPGAWRRAAAPSRRAPGPLVRARWDRARLAALPLAPGGHRLCRQLPARTPDPGPGFGLGLAGPGLQWARTLRRLTSDSSRPVGALGLPPTPGPGGGSSPARGPGPAGVRVPVLAGAAGRRIPLPSRRRIRAARALAAAPAPRGLGRAGEGESGGRRAGGREAGPGEERGRGGWRAVARRAPHRRSAPPRPSPKARRERSSERALQGAQPKALGTVPSDTRPAARALVFTGAGTEGTGQPWRVAVVPHPPRALRQFRSRHKCGLRQGHSLLRASMFWLLNGKETSSRASAEGQV